MSLQRRTGLQLALVLGLAPLVLPVIGAQGLAPGSIVPLECGQVPCSELQLWVDGQPWTPVPVSPGLLELPLLAGRRTLTVAAPGRQAVSLELEVPPGGGRMAPLGLAELVRQVVLELAVLPVAAEVWIDGRPVGPVDSRPRRLSLAPGDHRFVLRAPGYRRQHQTVQLPESGSAYHLTLTLDPAGPPVWLLIVGGTLLLALLAAGLGSLWVVLACPVPGRDRAGRERRPGPTGCRRPACPPEAEKVVCYAGSPGSTPTGRELVLPGPAVAAPPAEDSPLGRLLLGSPDPAPDPGGERTGAPPARTRARKLAAPLAVAALVLVCVALASWRMAGLAATPAAGQGFRAQTPRHELQAELERRIARYEQLHPAPVVERRRSRPSGGLVVGPTPAPLPEPGYVVPGVAVLPLRELRASETTVVPTPGPTALPLSEWGLQHGGRSAGKWNDGRWSTGTWEARRSGGEHAGAADRDGGEGSRQGRVRPDGGSRGSVLQASSSSAALLRITNVYGLLAGGTLWLFVDLEGQLAQTGVVGRLELVRVRHGRLTLMDLASRETPLMPRLQLSQRVDPGALSHGSPTRPGGWGSEAPAEGRIEALGEIELAVGQVRAGWRRPIAVEVRR